MEPDTSIKKRGASYQPKWLTLLRIALGLIILWKGISFFQDTEQLNAMVQTGGVEMFNSNAKAIAFIITYVNLLGGVFIAVGFITRWVCAVQFPIIIGAIIFVNSKAGMGFTNTEMVLSVFVLILLIVFFIKGSGVISADEYFRNYNKAGHEQGHTQNFFK